MKRIVVTGAGGLIGWHAHVRLHAANCAARFKGSALPYDIVALTHQDFDNDEILYKALVNADAVLHFAGVNRASDEEVEFGNRAIAERLVANCKSAGCKPHIVYANSTHSAHDSPYGRGKRAAASILGGFASSFSNLVLPHIFGECARPNYNNVTATLIQHLIQGNVPEINPEGVVHLLHAGVAAQVAIESQDASLKSELPEAQTITVPDLLSKLQEFHRLYENGIYPDLRDNFALTLFNAYRSATYPVGWPRPIELNTDVRGTLFEAVKGGGGGQTFLSTTEPGVTRGDHFHIEKVERFLVVQGEAVIRIRKVLTDEVHEFPVSGAAPACVDMPTLHTHSIENVGDKPLLTLFWAHEIFDPVNPDTYSDQVIKIAHS